MGTNWASPENVEVGTIVVYAYSYNARHPQFCRVIRKTHKSVQVEYLAKTIVSHDGYGQNGTCIPNENEVSHTDPKLHRFTKNGFLKINDRLCWIYEGEPEDFYTD